MSWTTAELLAHIVAPKRGDHYAEASSWTSWPELCGAVDLDALAYREFNEEEFEKRFHAFAIAPWYCTDQWVGLYAIQLDGETVALTFQEGRKCNTNYKFVSPDHATKVQTVLQELVAQLTPDESAIAFIDLDEVLDDRYKVSFAEQVLGDVVYYNGEECKRIQEFDEKKWPLRRFWDDPLHNHLLLELPSGEQKHVVVDDLDLPYINVKPKA